MSDVNEITTEHGATHVIEPDLARDLRAESDLQSREEIARSGADLTPEAIAEPVVPDRVPRRQWWHCYRLGSVSGRYQGQMTAPNAGDYALDLRVDIDPRGVNSPVLDRVSGDIYRVFTLQWWGRTITWRVYQRSWIVNNPRIVWGRCKVTITGSVTFWKGGQSPTNLNLVIPWATFRAAGPAKATLTTASGSAEYTCARKSANFRDIHLEADQTQSVGGSIVLPAYNTHAHATRPAGIVNRDLTVERAYQEAGIGITVRAGNVIDDSDPAFTTWSPAELHDAMESHFSQLSSGWPKWDMWGLLCGRYQSSGTAGIMFDAAATYGGAGEAPERQGFAVFREHSWFNSLPAGAPSNQAEAWALRQFLYTWVHEAGHAFNMVHSWNKSRPNALSWMNYPQNVAGFWNNFEFRFDDPELIHLRHGDRSSVIMGGDAWATGLHLHDGAEMGNVEGEAPLELIVRSKGYFALMEEVRVELRLRNLLDDAEIPIDHRLDPRYGTVAIYIMRPNGELREFEPVFCEVGEPDMLTLKPRGATRGLDRYSHEVAIDFGRTGHNFSSPGEYRIRAVYLGAGDVMIPSPVHTLRVGTPLSREEDRLAQEYYSFAAGLCMTLGGSRSKYLESGYRALETVVERCAGSVIGAKIAACLAEGKQRPFFAVDPSDMKLRKRADADPENALALTSRAIKALRGEREKGLNITYHNLARQHAALLAQAGRRADAKKELRTTRKHLHETGVNEPVLETLDRFADAL